jgi:hypothetical protein
MEEDENKIPLSPRKSILKIGWIDERKEGIVLKKNVDFHFLFFPL